jgi:ABC-type multidrug transport system permease subunit
MRVLLRLQFNLNKTRYFVLIVFIEELLNIQYFLFFLLVCTRINQVFQRVSKPHTVNHLRSIDFPNLVHTLVAMSLCFVDGHCKSESHRKLQTFELARHIRQNHWNAWQQYIFSYEFPFKIVASMILFIIFFTGHLLTDHLVT